MNTISEILEPVFTVNGQMLYSGDMLKCDEFGIVVLVTNISIKEEVIFPAVVIKGHGDYKLGMICDRLEKKDFTPFVGEVRMMSAWNSKKRTG